MEDYDWPPRGFLSYNPEDERVDDRQYLTGNFKLDEKANPDGWIQTRNERIRKRTKAAIRDFGLLFQELEPEERRLIFTGDHGQPQNRGGNPLNPNQDLSDVEGDFEWDFLGGWKGPDFRPAKGDEEVIHAIADTVAFLWLGCYDAHVNPEEVIETGINRAMGEINRRRSAEVSVVPDVHIERRQSMAIRARKKIERGEELIDAEARALLDQDEEIVPAGIVFDYLRGEINSYEIPPLPFEDTDDE